jgi:heavy metal sensor kinase
MTRLLPRPSRLPLRVRLTAWYVALLGVILAALAVFLLLRLRTDLVSVIDDELDGRAAEIGLGLGRPGHPPFRQLAEAELAGRAGRQSAAQLLDVDGRVLDHFGGSFADRPLLGPAELARARAGGHVRVTVRHGVDPESVRVLAVPLRDATTVPLRDAGATRLLLVASSLDGVDDSVDRLQLLLLLAVPCALAVAGAGGWLLARKALLPVARMTSQAGAIGADRLNERVSVPPASDELARLAETLNAMLDRIERGVADQRRFVGDASHELRTPLAIMQAELEVGLRGMPLPADARELLASIVEDLLTLAHVDEGRLELLPGPVDLAELCAAVTAKLRGIADAKGLELAVDGGGVEVVGDHARLAQVVTNLVDNAVKYTAPGGRVRLQVRGEDGTAAVSVRDTGPGIPPEALPRVFDRFFRLDAARSRAQGGSGLGLAICKEIVEAHGGRIWAESTLGQGSTFTISLPR